MFALIALLLPRRYKPYVDRLAAGLILGAVVGFTLADAASHLVGDAAFYLGVVFMVAGVVVAWRTRRR